MFEEVKDRLLARLRHSWNTFPRTRGSQFLLWYLLIALFDLFVLLLIATAFACIWTIDLAISTFLWWWDKLLEEPVDAVVILLVFVILGAIGSATLLHIFVPQTTLQISPFESATTDTTPVAFKDLRLNGKMGADLLKDEVNDILDRAKTSPQTTSNEPYGNKGQTHPHSIALGEKPEISSVGIEVEGISLDKVVDLYGNIRQDQRHLEGDLIFSGSNSPVAQAANVNTANSPCAVSLLARMPDVGNWKTSAYTCDQIGLRSAAHELAESFVSDFSPNTFARYLQNVGRGTDSIALLRKLAAADPTNIRSILDLAGALFVNGDYPGAIAEYNEALSLSPKYPEQVYNNLGVALYASGQVNQAEASYREAIRLNGSYADPHNNLGNLLRTRQSVHGATREFLTAMTIDNDNADAHDNYGLILDSQGKIDASLHQFREAVRARPERADLHIDLAAELEKLGDFDAAITEYREAVRIKPTDQWGHLDLGYALTENGQLPEGQREIRESMKYSPGEFAEAHNSLGLNFEAAGNYPAAVDEYSWAVRINPSSTLARCNLAHVLLLSGDYEAFRVNYDEAIKNAPDSNDMAAAHRRFAGDLRDERDFDDSSMHDGASLQLSDDPYAYAGLGFAAFERGDDKVARAMFTTSNTLSDNEIAHLGLGTVYEDKGLRRAAIEEYRQAARLNPYDGYPHRLLANSLESEGQYQEARGEREKGWDKYRLVVQRRPADPAAKIDMGLILLESGAYREATSNFDQALQINPDNADTHNNRGAAEENWNNQEEAIDEYNKAIAIKSNYMLAYGNLGLALDAEGRHREAQDVLKRGLERSQEDIWLRTDLGLSYDNGGDFQSAILEHRAAIGISNRFRKSPDGLPNFPEGHSNLCRALMHATDYDGAIKECEMALSAAPHDPEILLNYGDALTAKGRHCRLCSQYWLQKKAEDSYAGSIKESFGLLNLRPDADTYYLAGRAYQGLGDEANAIAQFQEALQWKSIYPKAHYAMSASYRRMGQSEAAESELAIAQNQDASLPTPP